jgi:hypothetical protein
MRRGPWLVNSKGSVGGVVGQTTIVVVKDGGYG